MGMLLLPIRKILTTIKNKLMSELTDAFNAPITRENYPDKLYRITSFYKKKLLELSKKAPINGAHINIDGKQVLISKSDLSMIRKQLSADAHRLDSLLKINKCN